MDVCDLVQLRKADLEYRKPIWAKCRDVSQCLYSYNRHKEETYREKLFELNLNFKSVAVPEAAASVSM